ncbi:dTDP-4-dehydrorhamnose 3,5-epimerase [Dissulfurirhabdus thermomarina]|uniref:dTDP-4-dehydrorhamnose 3,5-epimerase n=1 Tax=Dissulfurirhabdus thermomarina TaxID=1765737 RepID=A0A6N9TQG1_DISTH|nr:dTDP-4-dehydrorhamnose 3,5-epimerase family protein [Dissulfurirhabdus thermomarina]NDY43288.1 dTDP-4-dehydrorhamnose 3,5-epimerase [Dissulfurirhabdus thermomarina]NMX24175.1 dTDP-4-dehydrorhamnose 3,5-epimerase [Dissulfurirhabdus thermomarina]
MKDTFCDGDISGVIVRRLARHEDPRGWLCEVFRRDEIAPEHLPAMAYVSLTHPGVARGPHAHRDQTDLFGFVGPGTFRVRLWDAREGSPSRGARMEILAGEEAPTVVIVPPGVVHGYRNVGEGPGLVFNCPNRLYAGEGRREPVDEIRYEDDPDSPFPL